MKRRRVLARCNSGVSNMKTQSAVYAALAGALLLAGCAAPPAKKASAAEAPAQEAADEDAEIAAAAAAEIAKAEQPGQPVYGTNEARSPFERETVIRLNAIVQRSLDAINEYDGRRKEIREAAAVAAAPGADDAARAKATEGISFIDGLYDRAKAAFDDLKVAENDVKTSGEFYNDAILAGMVTFVTKVEVELREEKESLSAQISGASKK
jgi:hypothetical protein